MIILSSLEFLHAIEDFLWVLEVFLDLVGAVLPGDSWVRVTEHHDGFGTGNWAFLGSLHGREIIGVKDELKKIC